MALINDKRFNILRFTIDDLNIRQHRMNFQVENHNNDRVYFYNVINSLNNY